MRRLALVALLLTGCGPFAPLDVVELSGICGADVVPMEIVAAPEVDPAIVRDAAGMWGNAAFAEEDPATRWEDCRDGCIGVMTVYHSELREGVLGDCAHALTDDGRGAVLACEIRLAWDGATGEVLGHEAGHCFGLDHSTVRDSVMRNPILPGAQPTAAQMVRVLEGCPDG